MKVMIAEFVQGSGIQGTDPLGNTMNVLAPGKAYEVGDDLGEWIVANHKGVEMAKGAWNALAKQAEPVEDATAQVEPVVDVPAAEDASASTEESAVEPALPEVEQPATTKKRSGKK